MTLTDKELGLVIRALANQIHIYGKEEEIETLFMKILKHLKYID